MGQTHTCPPKVVCPAQECPPQPEPQPEPQQCPPQPEPQECPACPACPACPQPQECPACPQPQECPACPQPPALRKFQTDKKGKEFQSDPLIFQTYVCGGPPAVFDKLETNLGLDEACSYFVLVDQTGRGNWASLPAKAVEKRCNGGVVPEGDALSDIFTAAQASPIKFACGSGSGSSMGVNEI